MDVTGGNTESSDFSRIQGVISCNSHYTWFLPLYVYLLLSYVKCGQIVCIKILNILQLKFWKYLWEVIFCVYIETNIYH